MNRLADQIKFGPLESVATPNFAEGNVGDIISALIPYLFAIAGFLLIIYLLYGGYKYLLSRGDPKAIQEARGAITTALIGFIIVFSAFWLVQLVGELLGITVIRFIFKEPFKGP